MEDIEFIKVQKAEELFGFCLNPEKEFEKQPYFMVVNKFSPKNWEIMYNKIQKNPVFIKFSSAKECEKYEKYIRNIYKKIYKK